MKATDKTCLPACNLDNTTHSQTSHTRRKCCASVLETPCVRSQYLSPTLLPARRNEAGSCYTVAPQVFLSTNAPLSAYWRVKLFEPELFGACSTLLQPQICKGESNVRTYVCVRMGENMCIPVTNGVGENGYTQEMPTVPKHAFCSGMHQYRFVRGRITLPHIRGFSNAADSASPSPIRCHTHACNPAIAHQPHPRK